MKLSVFIVAACFALAGCTSEPPARAGGSGSGAGQDPSGQSVSSQDARPSSSVTVTRTAEGYLFMDSGDSVMVYRAAAVEPERAHARAHYVHPLYSLDGTVLTEDFPEDHLHQHGLYWGWHQIFVGERSVGNGWVQEDVEWDVAEVEVDEAGPAAELRAHVLWTSPNYVDDDGEPAPFIEEMATFRVHPAGAGYREIDVEIALRGLVDGVRLGGSEDEKGYGGLSLRVRLPEDVRFTGPSGPVEPQETAVDAGPWVDLSATYAGDGSSGIAILQHPSNPGFPQPWILRRAQSMQNPAWPGRQAVELPTDSPIVLRYRLVVHDGGSEALPVDELHARYK